MNNRTGFIPRNQANVDFSYFQVFISSAIILLISGVVNLYFVYHDSKTFEDVQKWLVENELEKFSTIFKENGYDSLQKVSSMSKIDISLALKESWLFASPKSTMKDVDLIASHIQALKRKLQFKFWLNVNDLKHLEDVFYEYNLYTLSDVLNNIEQIKRLPALKDSHHAVYALEKRPSVIYDYPVSDSNNSLFVYICKWIASAAEFVIVITLVTALSVMVVFSVLFQRLFRGRVANKQNENVKASINKNHGFITNFFGNYFDAQKSIVIWNDSDVVGVEVIVTIQFLKHNGLSYNAADLKSIHHEVMDGVTLVQSQLNYCGDTSMVTLHFMPIKAGLYSVSVLANNSLVGNIVHQKYFKPGALDPFKSSVDVPSSLLVLQEQTPGLLTFNEKDKYGNACISKFEDLCNYRFEIRQGNAGQKRITPQLSFMVNEFDKNAKIQAWITLRDAGVYTAIIYYDNEIVCDDDITMLVLTKIEMLEVDKNVLFQSWNLWYEVYLSTADTRERSMSHINQTDIQMLNSAGTRRRRSLVSRTASNSLKRKKVYCYITPKFLVIKEFYLKIIPRKIHTFRIKPSVKIFLSDNDDEDQKGFQIETHRQVVEMYSRQRNIIVATFVKLLLKNIGGSESFEDKKNYFYSELLNLHPEKAQSRVSIKVNRTTILKDTLSCTKSFSSGDWWKRAIVTFEGEIGLDYGGLTREWLHLLIDELFNTHGSLFRRFNQDDQQGLIHPNPFRKDKYQKVKLFELAGQLVGKCLVECACSPVRQQYVKARFTRSFLSLLLGANVHWKHFSTDDKEYYTGKIKYILENDPEYLDLTFTEDVYDNDNHLIKTIELKANGSKIDVREGNKMEYIQRLAEYRLHECVKEEIHMFNKGLNFVIPEGLLSIFDENELELLICGMDYISPTDLKANCVQAGGSHSFEKVMKWFWTIVSSFSQEEMSRLLQFTTGCSQLPPDGFSGLVPRFQITAAGGLDSLPTAHTCFNNLCLPNYSSCDELRKKLAIALTEGSEGFGMI